MNPFTHRLLSPAPSHAGFRCLIASLALVPAAFAQSTSATPPASTAEEPIILSAFEVKSANDRGYTVENAVATTGIAQSLTKTPLPITVVTEEFLRDAMLTGFTGAVSYVSSIAIDPHAGNGNYSAGAGLSQPNLNRFRGQPVNGTFRNGLNQSVGFDTENVDRIEVAKGPLSVFVGGATLGGEINVVTKKPLFSRKNEVTATIGEHESYGVTADLTGPIDERKTLAYRFIASYKDGNTWRDFSHRATRFLEPQLLWRPTEKLIARVDYVHRMSRGNNVSQNVSDTGNYQADFDSPRQILLDQGKKRTGALAGIPYTANEYRARIGQAFGNWRQDVFDATGQWTTLGGGELGLTEGLFPGGRTYNSYGPHAGVMERSDMLESEVTLVATDWLQARFLGRGVKDYNAQDYFSFSQRLQPSGSYNLTSGYQGARFHNESRDAKLEAVLKHKVWIADVNFLVGGQYGDNKGYNERAIFDYTNVPPIASSPNVIYGAPQGTLTGANVYTYFDPRVHPFPDNRLITRWPSEVSAAGVMAFSHLKVNNRAVYAAGSGGFFNDRVILTGGVRRTWLHSVTSTFDRNWARLTSTSTGNPYTDNWTAGVVVQLLPGLNAYASTSEGETIRTGSLIGRVTFGTPAPPLDIVSPAEQAANPVPNAIGKGKEAGLKFELFNRKLTGSFGWFQLSNGNFIVIDNDRNAKDPRNIGTEVDPNPATADPGRRLQVSWSRPIDGNETAGFETDLVWAPNPNYSMVFAASHLYTNKLTVVQPATSDPANQRTYLILNGRGLDNSPDDIVRVFQNYRFTNHGLRGANIGLGVRYQSSQSPSYSDANWGQLFPSYTVVDLVLGYTMKVSGNPLNFQLGVTNLTNKSYWTGNRIWSAPREFSLVTRYQF